MSKEETKDMAIDMAATALNRREVIRRAMLATGAVTLVGSNTLLNAACAPAAERASMAIDSGFSAQQIAWLDEVAETILPETSTPGAKAAEVGAFMAVMVTDTFSPQQREAFGAGMQALEEACSASHGVGFMQASGQQRLELLERLDQEQFDYHQNEPAGGTAPHYFRVIKEFTVLGYFTSEIGYTQAMRYVESPGQFEPCVDYVAGEPQWARHA